MRFGRRLGLLIAGVSVLAWAGMAHAEVFDNFNIDEGHFNQHPGYSGSSVGEGTCLADRVTTDGPKEGIGHQRLVLRHDGSTTNIRIRHLSGTGAPTNNVPFSTSSGFDGWIGFYLKTTEPGWTAQIWIEGDGGNNGGVPKEIIADGEWHLYEWNLDDTSGGPDGWGGIAGVAGGSATVGDGKHTIDSILLRNGTGPADVDKVFFLDFVARNPNPTPEEELDDVHPSGSVHYLLSQQCMNVPSIGGFNGPVVAGQTTVTLNNCATDLTPGNGDAIYVYADDDFENPIGVKTGGFSGTGTETVDVSPLVKGQVLKATQKKDGQESCRPDAPRQRVGGGPNPRLRVAFSIRENPSYTGPIGAPGGAGARIFWMQATGQRDNVALGSVLLEPSKSWQTVSAQRGPDPNMPITPVKRWYGDPQDDTLNGDFGSLDGLWFSIEDVDTGNYKIYIDELRNGSTLIQGWETTDVQFTTPHYADVTSGSLLLTGTAADLNSRVRTTAAADRGTGSLRVSWQWKDATGTQGLRFLANGDGGGTAFPQIDLRQPISVRVLLLPVGETAEDGPTIDAAPADKTVGLGGSASFSVQATKNPEATGNELTFRWLVNGVVRETDVVEVDGNGQAAATFILADLQEADGGTAVSVSVEDSTGSTHSDDAIITVTGCGVPFADADHDGDIDQADFGIIQGCLFNIEGEGCSCFDVPTWRPAIPPAEEGTYKPADGKVDMEDLVEFEKCAILSGPDVDYVGPPAAKGDCEGWTLP